MATATATMNATNCTQNGTAGGGGGGAGCDQGGDALWVVGVLLCLAGGVMLNFGINLQKLALLRLDDYLKSPHWLGGLVLYAFGNLMQVGALGFASQTLLAPIGSFALVSNIFIAHCLNGEFYGRPPPRRASPPVGQTRCTSRRSEARRYRRRRRRRPQRRQRRRRRGCGRCRGGRLRAATLRTAP